MASKHYEISAPQVIHETIDGEVVIINLDSGNYYSLRGSGARAWEGLGGGADRDAIVADLDRSFPGGSAVSADVSDFLASLEREGLIRPAEGQNGHTASPGPASEARAYEAPVLETFTDMRDLLLLDPVHEVDDTQGWPRQKPPA